MKLIREGLIRTPKQSAARLAACKLAGSWQDDRTADEIIADGLRVAAYRRLAGDSMPVILIDTDVLVRILRSGSWTQPMLQRLAAEETIVSVVSYGELYLGALKSDRQTDNLATLWNCWRCGY